MLRSMAARSFAKPKKTRANLPPSNARPKKLRLSKTSSIASLSKNSKKPVAYAKYPNSWVLALPKRTNRSKPKSKCISKRTDRATMETSRSPQRSELDTFGTWPANTTKNSASSLASSENLTNLL